MCHTVNLLFANSCQNDASLLELQSRKIKVSFALPAKILNNLTMHLQELNFFETKSVDTHCVCVSVRVTKNKAEPTPLNALILADFYLFPQRWNVFNQVFIQITSIFFTPHQNHLPPTIKLKLIIKFVFYILPCSLFSVGQRSSCRLYLLGNFNLYCFFRGN